MKLVSRLTIVFLMCLLTLPLLAPTTGAQDDGPYIWLSPTSGVPGDAVTVSGGNFTEDEWVAVYYYHNGARTRVAEVQVKPDRSFTTTFDIPKSCKGVHKVRAEVISTIYADANLTVKPGLTLSVAKGPVGATVTVMATGFAEEETGIELYFGGEPVAKDRDIEADAYGSWSASFQIPPSTGGSYNIRARGDDTALASVRHATFEVTPGITTDKSSGSPGESIRMTGGGFAANERNIKILFAGEAVIEGIRSDDRGYWQGPFAVPEMPRGTYIVTAEGDFTEEEDVGTRNFEIKPGITLSPDEGHVGMNVTATGRGFAADKDVVVMYEDDSVATATTDDKGTFETTFPVPESRHGGREVTGEEEGTGIKTEQPAIFTMESDPPPTPELMSPLDGRRVGFAGKVRPRFEWSEVEDVSGVYYSLQISASANITDAGEFVAPLVTRDRLVGSNYTLEKADALPHGTYYWIVQAVDSAENAGNWTAVQSFRAGRLPMWAFIVIIVLAVLGGAAAVYFYVIRRRMYL